MSGQQTFFAPAERADPELIEQQALYVSQHPLFTALLDSIDGKMLLLNPQRQVLAANQQLLQDLNLDSAACILGKRPGEIFECVIAAEAPSGCGTGVACSTCGALIAVLSSQERGEPTVEECLMTVTRDGVEHALEFRVRSTTVRFGDDIDFTVVVLNDISGEKRRQALERAFFHDLLNTIGGLAGWSRLLEELSDVDPRQAARRIAWLSSRLQHEVSQQRILLQGERGELQPSLGPTTAREILRELEGVFEEHPVARERALVLEGDLPEKTFETDQSLLVRVLVNMVKNALEAIEPGQEVRVGCRWRDDRPVFTVHNPGAIPSRVALQIFRRSFSSKGETGRGLGTYSMKLLGERYLGGKVDFRTSKAEGTTFWIALPGSGTP